MITGTDIPPKWGLAVAAALALASCAATTAPTSPAPTPPAPTPPAVNRLEYGTPATATPDGNGDMMLTPAGQTAVTVPFISNFSGISYYLEGGGALPLTYSKLLLVHQPFGTSGTSGVYWLDGTNGNAAGVFVTRPGPFSVPTGGSASFSGDYTGLLVRDSDNALRNQIHGTAGLSADFSTATINGIIYNRAAGGTAFADVTLNNAAIAGDGSFAGTTSGGDRISFVGHTTAGTGAYSGFILRLDPGGEYGGNALVGGISIPHVFSPGPGGAIPLTEYGAFSEIGGPSK